MTLIAGQLGVAGRYHICTDAAAVAILDDFVYADFDRFLADYSNDIITIDNQILKEGLGIYLRPSGIPDHEKVTSVIAGNHPAPTASTYDTQQEIQQPVNDVQFGKYSFPGIIESTSPNGKRITYRFTREGASIGSIDVTEMGVVVTDGVSSKLLCRITGSPIHTVDKSIRTSIIWEIIYSVI